MSSFVYTDKFYYRMISKQHQIGSLNTASKCISVSKGKQTHYVLIIPHNDVLKIA